MQLRLRRQVVPRDPARAVVDRRAGRSGPKRSPDANASLKAAATSVSCCGLAASLIELDHCVVVRCVVELHVTQCGCLLVRVAKPLERKQCPNPGRRKIIPNRLKLLALLNTFGEANASPGRTRSGRHVVGKMWGGMEIGRLATSSEQQSVPFGLVLMCFPTIWWSKKP
jgi:hypothetical protein